MLHNKFDSSNRLESLLIDSLRQTLKKKKRATGTLKRMHRKTAIAKIRTIRRYRDNTRLWESENS